MVFISWDLEFHNQEEVKMPADLPKLQGATTWGVWAEEGCKSWWFAEYDHSATPPLSLWDSRQAWVVVCEFAFVFENEKEFWDIYRTSITVRQLQTRYLTIYLDK